MSQIEIEKAVCWGLIPARGGSKSIPLKNLHPFAGRPLLDYVLQAGQKSKTVSKVFCSTDHNKIEEYCQSQGAFIHHRPDNLSGDQAAVIDTIIHFIEEEAKKGPVAEFIALLQPTSPFTRPEDIDACVEMLIKDENGASSQTTISCPHNHHAVNQRKIIDGHIFFLDREKRKKAYNKQKKEPHYLFGNVVVTRTEALLDQRDVFAQPSLPVVIEDVYGFDADNEFDFSMGEFFMEKGYITLNHL